MNLEEKIKIIAVNFKSLESELNQLQGQKTVLTSQIKDAKIKIKDLENTEELDKKAIEILNLVQKSTREKIQDAFQNLVTFALQSIYQAPYQFKLEFTTRGNIGELNFKLKDPYSNEYRDLTECVAGGSLDVISLALRFVLISVLRPKVEGPIILDESTKMLSRNFRQNEYSFYKNISEKLGKQLIIVTHASEIIDLAENKILIGKG
jgi:DNA repair exonuclease SbcCD ATPase subunit